MCACITRAIIAGRSIATVAMVHLTEDQEITEVLTPGNTQCTGRLHSPKVYPVTR